MYPSESIALASHLHVVQLGGARGNGFARRIARLDSGVLVVAIRQSSVSFARLCQQGARDGLAFARKLPGRPGKGVNYLQGTA